MRVVLRTVLSMKRMVRQSLLQLQDELLVLILDCSWLDLLRCGRNVTPWKASAPNRNGHGEKYLAINRTDQQIARVACQSANIRSTRGRLLGSSRN